MKIIDKLLLKFKPKEVVTIQVPDPDEEAKIKREQKLAAYAKRDYPHEMLLDKDPIIRHSYYYRYDFPEIMCKDPEAKLRHAYYLYTDFPECSLKDPCADIRYESRLRYIYRIITNKPTPNNPEIF